MIARRGPIKRLHAVMVFTNNLLEITGDRWHNGGIRNLEFPMQRYSINTPLVAIRLCPSSESDKAGVMTSLPSKAIVETLGPSNLGKAMVEVSWERQRYAVFQRDLATRATLVRTAAVGD
jgi:hypothetical protein